VGDSQQPQLLYLSDEQLTILRPMLGFAGKAALLVWPPPPESALLLEMRADIASLREQGVGLASSVGRFGEALDTVARGQYELRKENEELRQLNKEGYFKFAVRVNGADFLAFAVIMALGNRKAAAEHLKIAPRTFYHRVDQCSGCRRSSGTVVTFQCCGGRIEPARSHTTVGMWKSKSKSRASVTAFSAKTQRGAEVFNHGIHEREHE